jgi:hypothetical protein
MPWWQGTHLTSSTLAFTNWKSRAKNRAREPELFDMRCFPCHHCVQTDLRERLAPGVSRPKREANHSPASNIRVRTSSTSVIYLSTVDRSLNVIPRHGFGVWIGLHVYYYTHCLPAGIMRLGSKSVHQTCTYYWFNVTCLKWVAFSD